MKYTVQLCPDDEIINVESFHTDNEAFIYIGRVITNSLFPIGVAIERKSIIKDGIEIITELVYHLYRCECE